MSAQFFGYWTEDEIERNLNDPNMEMTDKEHHDFMVSNQYVTLS